MKRLLKRLYVVTGGLTIEGVARAIQRGGTVTVNVQKHIAVHGKPFTQAWEDPAQCTMKLRSMDNNLARANVSDVLNLAAKVVNVEATHPTPKARQFAGAEELVGLDLNLLYDFEQGAGVILNGYNGSSKRPTIEEPRLGIAVKDCDDDPVNQKVLEFVGVPNALLQSEDILRELGVAI